MSAVNKDLVIAEGTTLLAYSAIDKDTLPGMTYFGTRGRPAIWCP